MAVSETISVHLRISDAESGKPTPVRLRIAGSEGELLVPQGRSGDFPLGRNEAVGAHVYLGRQKYVYIDGSCEVVLPVGVPLRIEVSKGLEFEPIETTVTIAPGQLSLRLTIKRWTDSTTAGWLSADTRCHFLPPHTALLEAAAEDLSIVHLLATEHDSPSNDGHLYRTVPNITAFSGQRPIVECERHAVAVNTFNTHPALGRIGLLNSHRPVYPLSFGSIDRDDDWSLCDWCDQCHRKGGLVIWSDAFRPLSGLPGGEALIALILGKIDALEIDALERTQPFVPLWYRILEAGIDIPLVGGSGKDSNRIALGSMRTYTSIPGQERGLAQWVDRTRRGASFVTNGPLIDFQINGRTPGDNFTLSNGNADVAIRAQARSIVPFDRLEIVANGDIIEEMSPSGSPLSATIEMNTRLPRGGWVAARCRGNDKSALYPHLAVLAHSSPVYITIEGKRRRIDATALQAVRQWLEQTREWIETQGRFTRERSRIHLLELSTAALRRIEDLETSSLLE